MFLIQVGKGREMGKGFTAPSRHQPLSVSAIIHSASNAACCNWGHRLGIHLGTAGSSSDFFRFSVSPSSQSSENTSRTEENFKRPWTVEGDYMTSVLELKWHQTAIGSKPSKKPKSCKKNFFKSPLSPPPHSYPLQDMIFDTGVTRVTLWRNPA